MIQVKRTVNLAAIAIFVSIGFLLSGCTMPPDLIKPPRLATRPDIQLDESLSGNPAIPSKLLEESKADPLVHRAILLEEGESSLLPRIHLIRSAKKSIDLQTFIYIYDDTGFWVYKELLAAARRGVRVRLLVDHIVSPDLSKDAYAGLVSAHKNLEVRIFRPIDSNAVPDSIDYTQNTFMRFSTMNYRMHNKTFIVDDQTAIVGGRNIQDAYYDRDSYLSFIDRDVLVTGPSVREIKQSFDTFWDHKDTCDALRMVDLSESLLNGSAYLPEQVNQPVPTTYSKLDSQANAYDMTRIYPELRAWTVENIRFISDQPVKTNRMPNPFRHNPFNEIYSLMENADREVLIQTPYPIMEDKTYKRLKEIRDSKPDLRICLSTNSLSSGDHVYVSGLALKQRRFQIESLRLELYAAKPVPDNIRSVVPRYELLLDEAVQENDNEWWIERNLFPSKDPGPRFCLHSKSMVIDNRICLIGSHNFDPRSVYLNSECMVIIEDAAFSRYVASKIEQAIQPGNSWVVAQRDLPPVVGDLNSLITSITSNLPLFDIWPLEHVSCYELKDGMTPVSPYHPDFHDHYEDVGPFPGLDIGLDQIKVMLIRAFASPALKLM